MFGGFGGMFDPNANDMPTVVKPGFRWRTPRGAERNIECDVYQWQPPGSEKLVVQQFIVVPCPACQHHMVVGLRQDAIAVDGQSNLTLGAVLKCPAYWPKRDSNGQPETKRGPDGKLVPVQIHCGWTGVIREGIAHAPSCACCNMQKQHAARNCTCGQIVVRD